MAITEYFCDPSLGADGGTGTFGDPFGAVGSCLQYALDNIPAQNVTDGDRLVLLDTATDTLTAALDLSTYGTPNTAYPLFLEGRQSDGAVADYETGDGMATIDLNNGAYYLTTNASVHCYHLDITNGSGTGLVGLNAYQEVNGCYLSDSAGYGVSVLGTFASVINCHISNCATIGVYTNSNDLTIKGCYFKSTASDSRTAMTGCVSAGANAYRTSVDNSIMSVDGSTYGMSASAWGLLSRHNSILAASGSSYGIANASIARNSYIHDNCIEGFSNSGTGIEYQNGGNPGSVWGNNAIYNCSTISNNSTSPVSVRLPDFTLTKTPFLKSGADTFANRKNYFAPRSNVGTPYL